MSTALILERFAAVAAQPRNQRKKRQWTNVAKLQSITLLLFSSNFKHVVDYRKVATSLLPPCRKHVKKKNMLEAAGPQHRVKSGNKE